MKTLIILFLAATIAATACNDNGKSRNAEDTARATSPTTTDTARMDSTHMGDTTMHR